MKRLALALVVCVLLPVSAQAAISRVGSCAAQATSCTFSVAPSAGDVIFVFAHRDNADNNPPTIPSTHYWAAVQNTAGANANGATLVLRISNGTETTTDTWNGMFPATSVAAVIYRGAEAVAPAGQYSGDGSTGTGIVYDALTPMVTDGSSWVVGFGAHKTATNVGTAPSGMALVTSATDIAVSDTNAGTASYAGGTVTVNASSGWRSYTVELKAPIAAESATKLNVDNFLHLNVAGTTFTVTNLANGNDGVDDPPTCTPATPPTGETIGTHFQALPNIVHVRSPSTDYATSTTTKAVDVVADFTSCEYDGLWSNRKRGAMSVAGWVKFGAADEGSSGNLFDMWRVENADGSFCVMQLQNGNFNGNGTGYGINIEADTQGTGTPNHSALITLTPGSTYWVSLYCNYQTGEAKLAAYTTAGAQVGTTATATLFGGSSNGSYIEAFKWGNQEVGTAANPTNSFEDILVDYTTAAFPLGPTAGAAGGTVTRMLLGVGQ